MEDDAKGKGLMAISIIMILYALFEPSSIKLQWFELSILNPVLFYVLLFLLLLFFLFRYWQKSREKIRNLQLDFFILYASDYSRIFLELFHKHYFNDKHPNYSEIMEGRKIDYSKSAKQVFMLSKENEAVLTERFILRIKDLPDYKKKFFQFVWEKPEYLTLYIPYILAGISLIVFIVELFIHCYWK